MATRTYAGQSAESRAQERRKKLLDACLELLGSKGAQATTVRGVCREAGLTERYFYESFDDLDTLMVAVLDRVVATVAPEILFAVAKAPNDAFEKANAAIDTFVRYVTDDPRRARVLFMEAWGNEALTRRRLDGMRMFSDLVAAQGRQFFEDAPQDDPIADVTASMLVGGMAESLLAWLDGRLAMSREDLVRDMTELFVASGESAVAIARRRKEADA